MLKGIEKNVKVGWKEFEPPPKITTIVQLHWHFSFWLSSTFPPGILLFVLPGEAGSELELVNISPGWLLGQYVCSQRAATGAQQLAAFIWIQVPVCVLVVEVQWKSISLQPSYFLFLFPPSLSLEHLDNMEKLDLSYNQLASVGAGVFKGLSRLRQLYLNNNRLTVVQQGSLDMLPGLEVL